MSDLEWLETPGPLREPVLVAAWHGWNDAAEAATAAVRFLRDRWASSRVAQIDPDDFYDFTQARPTIRLVAGNQRALDWPQNEFWVSQEPLLPNDFVLFVGAEPHIHWRGYLAAFGEVIEKLKIARVITLGGLIADATHTRPVPIAGFSNDPTYAQLLLETNVRSTNYEGPTGIVGVLSDHCRSRDLAAISLWASAPPYISGMSYPRASLALLTHVDQLLHLELDLGELESAAERVDAQIADAVSKNSEIAEYVRRLERHFDDDTRRPQKPPRAGREPPREAGSLIEELEEFLKRSREGEEGQG